MRQWLWAVALAMSMRSAAADLSRTYDPATPLPIYHRLTCTYAGSTVHPGLTFGWSFIEVSLHWEF